MKMNDVRKRLAEIKNESNDDEAAHSLEDKLYQEVLEAIAEEKVLNPAAIADLALTAREINFSRWTA